MKLDIQLFGASASVQSAKYDGRYLKLTLTETETSIENNTSTIYWKFESIGGSSSYYTIYNYGVYINGSQVYDGTSGDKTKNYSNHSLPVTKGSKDGYVTITHNADGTASDVSFSLHGKVYKSGTETHTGSLVLSTIPRASQPSLSTTTPTMGSAFTIYTNRVSDTFTHTIRYWFGNANGTIASNVATSTSWTPPLDLANQIPSSTSGVGTIYCDTYQSGNLIGTKTINFTLNVPSSVVPSVSFTNVSETGDVPSSWGVYVKNKSRIALAISGSGTYSSSIASYVISYYGGSITSASGTTSYLTQAGSTTFTGQVTDTRGRGASTTTTINVVDYYNPTISTAQVQRCDVDGNIDNNGEYMYISYGASISSVSNKNTPSAVYKVGYRVHNTGNYTYVNLTTNANSYSASGVLFSDGIKAASSSGTKVQFSSSNTYDIQFYVADYFTYYDNVQSLDTGFDLMNFNPSGKAMAIGKVSEAGANEELLEVGMNTDINGDLKIINPSEPRIYMDNTNTSGIVLLKNQYSTYIAGNNAIFFRPTHVYNNSDEMKLATGGDLYLKGSLIADGVVKSNIIYCRPQSDVSISAGSYVGITNLQQTYRVGSRLSVSNGQIEIGSGINYIKVSVLIGLNCSDDTLYSYLYKNNANYGFWLVAHTQGPYDAKSKEEIIPVSENDLISFSVYLGNGGSVSYTRTNIVVEAVG